MLRSPRAHIEMQPVDVDGGWQALPGFPPGLDVKILADDLDELNKTGARTRLVRFAPGIGTEAPLIHDYWEEVFLISGSIQPTNDKSANGQGLTYSCRPPGTPHGPFRSEAGCIMIELQYYAAERLR